MHPVPFQGKYVPEMSNIKIRLHYQYIYGFRADSGRDGKFCRKTLRGGFSLFVHTTRFLSFRCDDMAVMDGNDGSHLGAVIQGLNGMGNEGL